jgi:hypothetical protein
VRQANVIFITTKEIAADLRREEDASPVSTGAMPNILDNVRIMGGGFGGVMPPAIVPAAPAPAAPPGAGGNPPAPKPAEDKDKEKDKKSGD